MAKKVEFNMGMVKKYAFWACAPLGLVVAALLGMMAVADVGSKLEDRKKQLDSQKSAVESLRSGAASHPNQETIDEINEKTQELAGKIYTAWGTLVEEQQKQNRWEGISDGAKQDISRKNFLDPLEPATLTSYLNFNRNEIKKLLDNANINRVQPYRRLQDGRDEPLESNEPLLTSTSSGSGESGYESSGRVSRRGSALSMDTGRGTFPGATGGGGTTVVKGKVVWASPQVDITMKNWERQPFPYEVWLTQEDLWVHQALLWVVAKSNEASREARRVITPGASTGASAGAGVSRPLDLSDSVIKEIVELSIGRKAAGELAKQSSRRIGSGSYGGGGESEFGESSSGGFSSFGSFGSSGGEGEEYGGGMGPEAAKSAALAGRYVDDDGNPLMEADLTGQFRRMPVYLRFVVDQRRIADVLANCANCPMPIDVLWVTINPDATDKFEFASSGTGMGMGMDSESYTPRRGASGSGRSSASYEGGGAGPGIIGLSPSAGGMGGGMGGGANAVDYGADAVSIEIYGCINIFAPPDKQKITGETTGE